MLFSLFTSVLAASTVLAVPTLHSELVGRASGPRIPDSNTTDYTDAQVLQLALYFENLENAFL